MFSRGKGKGGSSSGGRGFGGGRSYGGGFSGKGRSFPAPAKGGKGKGGSVGSNGGRGVGKGKGGSRDGPWTPPVPLAERNAESDRVDAIFGYEKLDKTATAGTEYVGWMTNFRTVMVEEEDGAQLSAVCGAPAMSRAMRTPVGSAERMCA